MFGPVWNWAGRWRRLELNIGVAPEQIAVELRNMLDSIAYRWEHTDDWTRRQLGIGVHAETVRIYPFTYGNRRTTRFVADLVFAAVQNPTELQCDWEIDKKRHIELLRAYDGHRDVASAAPAQMINFDLREIEVMVTCHERSRIPVPRTQPRRLV